jgi:glycosyl transferase family 87
VAAGAFAVYDSIPLQADWGRRAAAPYVIGAVGSSLLAIAWFRIPERFRTMARATIVAAVFVAAVLVPLGLNIASRQRGPEPHAQSETLLTEEAAAALIRGENPYAVSYEEGPLGQWPAADWRYLPYGPGVLLFGLPHALGGEAPLSDARVIFLVVSVAAAVFALRVSKISVDRLLTVAAVLLVLPTGARSIVGGGEDISVLALMLLALVLSARSRPLAAGVTLGIAAAIKQTAWPLIPFLVMAARDRNGQRAGSKTLAGAGAVLVPVVLPFLVWGPRAFIEDTVLYPLGLTEERTLAGSPTVGRLLNEAFPSSRGVLLVIVAASVLAVAAFLLFRRPPASAAGAAEGAAILFTIAVLLATAGRFGYLIYPLNLVLWSRLLLGSIRTQPLGEAHTRRPRRSTSLPPPPGASRNRDAAAHRSASRRSMADTPRSY